MGRIHSWTRPAVALANRPDNIRSRYVLPCRASQSVRVASLNREQPGAALSTRRAPLDNPIFRRWNLDVRFRRAESQRDDPDSDLCRSLNLWRHIGTNVGHQVASSWNNDSHWPSGGANANREELAIHRRSLCGRNCLHHRSWPECSLRAMRNRRRTIKNAHKMFDYLQAKSVSF